MQIQVNTDSLSSSILDNGSSALHGSNSNSIDMDRIRKDSPGTTNLIHLNSAGASLIPIPVSTAVMDHLKLELEIGGYEAHAFNSEKVDAVYLSLSRLLHCKVNEIALMDNATTAWSKLFYSLKFQPGDIILTCQSEYGSNYISYLKIAKDTGAEIAVVNNDENGAVDVTHMKQLIDSFPVGKVKLISITHIPTNGGLINDAAAIGDIAQEYNIPYLLDACQSVGQLDLDVNKLKCSFLSGTSRKYLRGPRGVGFLYVKEEYIDQIEPVFLDIHAATWGTSVWGGPTDAPKGASNTAPIPSKAAEVGLDMYAVRPDARRFETWEMNYANVIGLGAAVDYALDVVGIQNIERDILEKAALFRQGLQQVHADIQLCDLGSQVQKCGIVTWFVPGLAAADIKEALTNGNPRINVSVSPPSSTLIDATARELPALVRTSISYYNSREEMEIALKEIGKVITTLLQK